MLLRHGRDYHGKSSWTQAHERHLSTIRFEQPAQEIAFNDYRQAAKDTDEHLQPLTEELKKQVSEWRKYPLIKLRLTHRYRHFRMGRKLHQNKTCIAIARELPGSIWDIARQVTLM